MSRLKTFKSKAKIILKIIVFIAIILLMSNINAIVDSFLHPEIPYFDEEHLIVGVFSGSITLIFLTLIILYINSLKKINKKHTELLKELTKSQEKEEEINQQLLRLNADKDKFISILAHDLKSPCNSILGFLYLLSINVRKYDMDKIEKQINLINNTAKSTYRLLEDILLWARANSGKLPFEPTKFDFIKSCSEVVENMQANALNKNLKINYFASGEIQIFADINMFKTILRNMLSNAIKYTGYGGTIDIYAEIENTYVMVSVSDNGIGIDPEKLIKIFDVTNTHTTPGTEGEEGSGLGLLLCKEFVDRHNGHIWVESEVGKGTKFKFTLPLKID